MNILWGLGGMAALMAIAVAFSSDWRAIKPRTVLGALAMQLAIGVLVLYWEPGQRALAWASQGVGAVIHASDAGIDFLFGDLVAGEGMVFALQVLPVVIFVASLVAVLFHLGIMQRVINVIGGALQWVLGTSRAESMNAAANVFVGQSEAPLFIRPYLARMTRSELFAVMVGGVSTVSGTVLLGYSLLGARLDYLIAASFMAAPAALLMAKIIIPETERAETAVGVTDSERAGGAGAAPAPAEVPGGVSVQAKDGGQATEEAAEEGQEAGQDRPRNVIDAAARGAADGLKLAATIGAMLLAFISLVALLNLILGAVGGLFGAPDLSFQQLIGYVFAPVMTLIGVPWSEAVASGGFVGQKIVLNEFVAFVDFAPQIEDFSPKTAAITTFALTGFANLGSLAILLGGVGSLVPGRRGEIAELGLRVILAGTLANLMSAAIAGMLIG
ncbi:NupC/NupG family nucleoside CNT transporter [Nocardiopsis aegyptia]|uniref:CNT family concentrative nucleoside transporter n=1 Tax=Nocardiopsis aegyptia TaxID=220378 RepID=A0A7Z0EUP1_9ACTN|nr:nucleoside transporter C-terminal domain-containing protein [Nocardiopsis aegyptia]NYJ38247.1 CNT family concentrative nucleoside transporter [Nocardiopsis aegyptia]